MENCFMKNRIAKGQDYKIFKAISHTQIIYLLRFVNKMHVEFLN